LRLLLSCGRRAERIHCVGVALASQTTIGATQRGLRRLISSSVRSLNPSVIRVCARGAMPLTVIPYCRSSVALMMVKAAMPAFAAP
jgi:hypothetical protein